MSSKSLAFIVLLAASVAAAGGGAYVAIRQNAATAAPAPANERDSSSGLTGARVPPEATSVAPQEPAAAPTVPLGVRPDQAAVPESSPAPAAKAMKTRAGRPIPSAPGGQAAAVRQSTEVPAPPMAPASTVVESGPAPIAPAAVPPVDPAPPVATVLPTDPPPTPQKEYVELVVPSDSVVGLQLETTVNSERARIEDRVEARVSRDVRVDGRVAIPAGSEVAGVVTLVERGGKIKNTARIGVRFHTVQLPDGTRASLATDTIVREGESPANRTTAKIGGAAIGGAILGAILGGGKGAAIGGSIGAAGGTAAAMSGHRNEVILPAGSVVSARLLQPVTVIVEK